jgi:hypothetical protein
VPERCIDTPRERIRSNWHQCAAVAKHFANRWPRVLASQSRARIHGGESWIENYDSRNRRLCGFEHESLLTRYKYQPMNAKRFLFYDSSRRICAELLHQFMLLLESIGDVVVFERRVAVIEGLLQ